MPDLVKIGYTYRTAEQRCAEVSQGTGVPMAYAVAYYAETTDTAAARTLEQMAHRALSAKRVNRAREHFRVSVELARETIEQLGHSRNLISITSTAIAQRAAAVHAENAARNEAARREYEQQQSTRAAQMAAAQKERERQERERVIVRLQNECRSHEQELRAHANRPLMQKISEGTEYYVVYFGQWLFVTLLFLVGLDGLWFWFIPAAALIYYMWQQNEKEKQLAENKRSRYNSCRNELIRLNKNTV